HSRGGLNVRVFNGLYPGEVAGAVLVDAAHEDEAVRAPRSIRGLSAPRWAWHSLWIAVQTARAVGLIRLLAPRRRLPDDPAKRTPDQTLAALEAQPKALANQGDATISVSYDEAKRSGGFGDRPLLILTQGKM